METTKRQSRLSPLWYLSKFFSVGINALIVNTSSRLSFKYATAVVPSPTPEPANVKMIKSELSKIPSNSNVNCIPRAVVAPMTGSEGGEEEPQPIPL